MKADYIPVGSIVEFTRDWLNGAQKSGSIKAGTRFRINRFDQDYFYIRKVNSDGSFAKNSYERTWNRTSGYGSLRSYTNAA